MLSVLKFTVGVRHRGLNVRICGVWAVFSVMYMFILLKSSISGITKL